MYWSINILAILLMIAILEIDPVRLESLTHEVSHAQLQLVSYTGLALAFVFWVIRYLSRSAIVLNRKHITSTYSLRSALASSIGLLLWLIPLFVAILTNVLAQRLSLIEQSIDERVYVEAWVTPLGLSDRQLEFTIASDTKTAKVTQGYRLLANLSQIKIYDTPNFKADSSTKHTTNPFSSSQQTLSKNSAVMNGLVEPTLPKTMTVLLTSFDAKHARLNTLQPNEQIRLQLALEPINSKRPTDPHEFDEYRWLSTRHATAKATVLKTNNSDNTHQTHFTRLITESSLKMQLDQYRYHLRQHLQQLFISGIYDNPIALNQQMDNTAKQQAMAVTLSLLTGDRSLINKETTALYRFAGISHLLAISGAHVLFLAILAAWLATRLVNMYCPSLYRHLNRWQVQFIIAVIVAFIYAMFSGFDVPASRTAWMLLLVGAARYLLLSRMTFKLLLGLATLMAWQDIFVLWQAGFWLSFVAVTLLVAYSQQLRQKSVVEELIRKDHAYNYEQSHTQHLTNHQTAFAELSPLRRLVYRVLVGLRYFVLLQLWMTLALLPVSLWLFGEVSLWGIMVNMVAIALFGWIIVPLNLLAGIIYAITSLFSVTSAVGTGVANSIWQLLFYVLEGFHHQLTQLQLATNHSGWLYTSISLPILGAALLIILPWLLPTGILSRLLSLPASLLCVFMLMDQSSKNAVLGLNAKTPTLVITPLPLDISISSQHNTLSATLLSTPFDNWLLLSNYPDSSYIPTNEPVDESKTTEMITNQLFKTLNQHQIDKLTGVIIQTPSQSLADSVNQLKNRMPINDYWQAGSRYLTESQTQFETSESSQTSLTMQPCDAGHAWRSQATDNNDNNNDNDSSPSALHIVAVTGWQNIKDDTVWDCAIQINTQYPVYLDTTDSKLVQPSNSGVNHISGEKVSTRSATKNVLLKPATGQNQTSLVFNSAQHKRVWQLWQMMCPIESTSRDSQSSLLKQHWLSPQAAELDKDMSTKLMPLSFALLNSSNAEDNEAILHWQQIINERRSLQY